MQQKSAQGLFSQLLMLLTVKDRYPNRISFLSCHGYLYEGAGQTICNDYIKYECSKKTVKIHLSKTVYFSFQLNRTQNVMQYIQPTCSLLYSLAVNTHILTPTHHFQVVKNVLSKNCIKIQPKNGLDQPYQHMI